MPTDGGFLKFRGPGPIAWCKRCSRKHPRRGCNLEEVERKSKIRKNRDGSVRRGGNAVVRLVHAKPKARKTKARKS